ncbi:peptidoglycan DD-metalloendopeptidase family protein [Rhodoflexus sp.]
METTTLNDILRKHVPTLASVVPFDLRGPEILHLDLTAANEDLHRIDLADTATFSTYIFGRIAQAGAVAAVGGYNEDRFVYHRSRHFDGAAEARTIHLGIDIWAVAGTPVAAPLAGIVHSLANNSTFGDYGYTIILEHQLEGYKFFTLYGHLSAKSVEGMYEGKPIAAGQVFAWFGEPHENGNWPPHLHFQLITDMLGRKGDFAGVCAASDRLRYLQICPDPAVILKLSD